ncbi:MAG TPA: cysteine synthase A [Polyangiaceae bacterium]|jgi:cysteine synthase A|nr:cysteine synthase A [Polyangiaceae bacterium]
MTIFRDIAATVGHTPMVELRRIGAGLPGRIVAKLESRNPCGSIKDRIGVAMIEDKEQRGELKAGMTIVECTSGNTGIALAFLAASRGYRLILTMPERMSTERIALLRYLGAEVVLTPGTLMREARVRAEELANSIPGSIRLEQFDNPANPEIHRRTTAVEIWDDTSGAVAAFVAGVGTGGTITGVGEVLKQKAPAVRIVAVEPENAAVLSGRAPKNHIIQGIGAGFIPKILNRAVIDEIATVSEDAAIEHSRRLAREEGILAGISSGAALSAALVVARRPELEGKLVVMMVCDTGERYASTPLMSALIRGN